MSVAAFLRRHLRHCLAAPPAALQALLRPLPAAADFWDDRPFAERFSPREVLAHAADWNLIFDDRITLTLDMDHPTFPELDEENLPIEHRYSTQDPIEALRRFCGTREAFIARVDAFEDGDWERSAHREGTGDLTVADQVVLVT